jgi:hypothetical protein
MSVFTTQGMMKPRLWEKSKPFGHSKLTTILLTTGHKEKLQFWSTALHFMVISLQTTATSNDLRQEQVPAGVPPTATLGKKKVYEAIRQIHGYMVNNGLMYGFLTT